METLKTAHKKSVREYNLQLVKKGLTSLIEDDFCAGVNTSGRDEVPTIVDEMVEAVKRMVEEKCARLKEREEEEREKVQRSLFEDFVPVDQNCDFLLETEEESEENKVLRTEREQLLKSRLEVWLNKFAHDPKIAEVDSDFAKKAIKERLAFAVEEYEGEGVSDFKISFESLSADLLPNATTTTILNWFRHNDHNTVEFSDHMCDLQSLLKIVDTEDFEEKYTCENVALRKVMGDEDGPVQESTTLSVYKATSRMFDGENVVDRILNACPVNGTKPDPDQKEGEDREKAKKKGKCVAPYKFAENADFYCDQFLNTPSKYQTDNIKVCAGDTIESFTKCVHEHEKKYALFRLHPRAYRRVNDNDVTVADTDFSEQGDRSKFGLYLLAKIGDNETGENDILVKALPAPSHLTKQVEQNRRGQSLRRYVAISIAYNACRRRPGYTNEYSPLAMEVLACKNIVMPDDGKDTTVERDGDDDDEDDPSDRGGPPRPPPRPPRRRSIVGGGGGGVAFRGEFELTGASTHTTGNGADSSQQGQQNFTDEDILRGGADEMEEED